MSRAPTGAVVAVTGATGFLGRRLIKVLADDGWTVRILARRDIADPAWLGLEPQLVIGDLANTRALAALCDGAEVVVHVAGLIKASSRAVFDRANVEGSRQVALAAKAAGARLVLVSSLAAREPQLSDYAASKRGGEDTAREIFGESLTIVRPPAIYGPGDVETLRLFKMASEAAILPVLDPRARMAWIHADDAAARIAALVKTPRPGLYALSDNRPDGYGWRELMQTAAKAVGASPRLVRIPAWAIKSLAKLSKWASIATGKDTILTPGKARELLHADWALSSNDPIPDFPPTRYPLEEGFAQSVRWYRSEGWLKDKKARK
ncbi:nucleoside-diphosphate-sugar epimerase [Caulobacter sp. AP07]|uniref:NAD-dependent epimerase/dehydratase family protein n=1 Tax=Caulobacter sp. AP07 TaxID=1144304 RepID=UPI000271EDFE|nr:NAD-dependent epimerase/dehydratase family protein [Caulobacter sp. AP07]EJL28020.1 nucleoside-diphosphate-sugar epimerase [Caulobacter sp. AP07]